jgi:hypothetical protein
MNMKGRLEYLKSGPHYPILSEEYPEFLEKAEALATGDMDRFTALVRMTPVHPLIGRHIVEFDGKDCALQSGWDFSECDKVYGPGWMDRVKESAFVRKSIDK